MLNSFIQVEKESGAVLCIRTGTTSTKTCLMNGMRKSITKTHFVLIIYKTVNVHKTIIMMYKTTAEKWWRLLVLCGSIESLNAKARTPMHTGKADSQMAFRPNSRITAIISDALKTGRTISVTVTYGSFKLSA